MMKHSWALVLTAVVAGCNGASGTSATTKGGVVDAAQAKAPDMATLYAVGRTWVYTTKATGGPKTESDTITIVVKSVDAGTATVETTNKAGTSSKKLDLKADDPFLGMNTLTAAPPSPPPVVNYAVLDAAASDATASGTATPSPTPTPTATPTPKPTATPTAKPSPTPTPAKATPTPKPSPTSTPDLGGAFGDALGGLTDAAAQPKVTSTKAEHISVAGGAYDVLHKGYSQDMNFFGAAMSMKYDTYVNAKVGMVKMTVNMKVTPPAGAKGASGPQSSTITMELKSFK